MMRSIAARYRGSRVLLQAVGSNIFIQAVQIAVQLLALPILVTHWGLHTYGVWLMLFTVPAYLAMADLGLASAAGNDMTASVARGNREQAIAVFQAVRLATMAQGVVLIGVAALKLYVLFPDLHAGIEPEAQGQARPALLALIAFGMISLQNGVTGNGYRATGGYATGGYLIATVTGLEAVAALAVVMLGGGIAAAAYAYLAARAIGSVVFGIGLAARARWLVTLRWRSSLAVLRALMRPAIAVMALPIAQAISLQGTVLVIGAAAGSSAVPAFTAVRTLSRVAVQCILIVNHALMPSFTAAAAVDDAERRRGLATVSTLTSFLFVLPAFLVLTFGGRTVVSIWTHGTVHPALSLVVAMACMMVVNAIWQPLSNLILSVNRHESYSYYYLPPIRSPACWARRGRRCRCCGSTSLCCAMCCASRARCGSSTARTCARRSGGAWRGSPIRAGADAQPSRASIACAAAGARTFAPLIMKRNTSRGRDGAASSAT